MMIRAITYGVSMIGAQIIGLLGVWLYAGRGAHEAGVACFVTAAVLITIAFRALYLETTK